MSDRAIEGARLVRALFYAQRDHDQWRDKPFDAHVNAEWCRTKAELDAAQAAFDAFVGADRGSDFKLKQAGERP